MFNSVKNPNSPIDTLFPIISLWKLQVALAARGRIRVEDRKHNYSFPLPIYLYVNMNKMMKSFQTVRKNGRWTPGSEVIKLFSCSTQPSMKFQRFIKIRIRINLMVS